MQAVSASSTPAQECIICLQSWGPNVTRAVIYPGRHACSCVACPQRVYEEEANVRCSLSQLLSFIPAYRSDTEDYMKKGKPSSEARLRSIIISSLAR